MKRTGQGPGELLIEAIGDNSKIGFETMSSCLGTHLVSQKMLCFLRIESSGFCNLTPATCLKLT